MEHYNKDTWNQELRGAIEMVRFFLIGSLG